MADHDRDSSLQDKETRDGADPTLMSQHHVSTRAKKKHAFLCVQTRRLPEARALYQAICEQDPRDGNAWFMLGTVCGRLGDAAAESALRTALSLAPDYPQALLNLGHALELQRRYAEAEDCYQRALNAKPDMSEAHESLGRIVQHRGDTRAALRHYQQALQHKPGRTGARLAAAKLLHRLGRLEEACVLLEQALAAAPDDAAAAYALAGVYLDRGRLDEALSQARLAQQLKPGLSAALALEAAVLLAMGKAEAARQLLAPVLDHYQTVPELALVHAQLCRHGGDREAAIGRLERVLSQVDLSEAQTQLAHARLGELYDAQARYQEAFRHFEQAKARKSARFDRALWARRIDGIIDSFSAEALARAPRAGNCSERPVFVVGMPYSGIDLVARILAAIPGVADAGEHRVMAELAMEFEMSCASAPGGAGLTQLSRGQCDEYAQRYLEKLEHVAPGAMRVVDTQADNYLHLGLISVLFPVAYIIHCVREPMDSCLAAYFLDLDDSHEYASDLGDLGFYHHQYQRLMRHWTRALGLPVLEVSYDDLASKPVQVAREVVKFCGLKPAPRGPHGAEPLNAEESTTDSTLYQASSPYPSGHWRHYEMHLAALKRELAGE